MTTALIPHSIFAFWQNNSLLTAICFLIFAATGSVLRWGMQVNGPWNQRIGTLSANLISSFLLGLFIASDFHPATITVLSTGFLGSLSTFSTVIMQTANESVNGSRSSAYIYISMTFVLGILAATLGLEIGSR
ncbi:MAG: CrcB family protein [Acidimicrobiales bacterium]|nr:CrcB family protein [Acidimicrobiales bacterium]HJM29195.1 CrcB family protein [Acidimicrobiales bacterium]HJM96739.1 CrcB family protein [Acidimicrobiales bacterium]